MDFWVNSNMMTMDSATQVFTILKQPDHDYLTKVCVLYRTKACS